MFASIAPALMVRRSLTRRTAVAACLLPLFAAPSVLLGQDQTLVRPGTRQYGGFGGPAARVTTVAGETMVMGGGGGAFLVDRRFAIGGAGFGGTRKVDARLDGGRRRGEMDVGYGGITFEVITQPSQLVHATFGALLGGGAVSVYPDSLRPRNRTDSDATFGVFEPQVGIELNVTRWFRMGATAGYRAAFGGETDRLADDNLSGPSGTLVFRFGKF
jgi:hypothetical protein